MDPRNFYQANQAFGTASAPAGAETMDQRAPVQETPPAATGPEDNPSGEPQEEQVDYRALAERERQQREAAEADRQRLQGTLQQVQQWAEQTAQQQQRQSLEQQYEQREQQILQQAEYMQADERNRYIASQMRNLRNELSQQQQQAIQAERQRAEQMVRQVATPLYIQDLVKQNGLPPEAAEELMSFGDPEIARQYVPRLKARVERDRQVEERLNQLSRSQQAQRLQESGVGMMGGTSVTSGLDLPDNLDPDTKAAMIFKHLRGLT